MIIKTLSGKRKISLHKGKLLEQGRKISRATLFLYSRNLEDIKIKPTIDVTLRTEKPRLKVAHLEEPSLSKRRQRGDQMFVAYFKGNPVAFLFGTSLHCRINEISDNLIVGGREVYLYDAYTLSPYRGNQIFPALIHKAISYYRGHDYSRVLIFTKQKNLSARKSLEKIGFHCYGTARLCHFFGLKIRLYGGDAEEIRTRFKHEINSRG